MFESCLRNYKERLWRSFFVDGSSLTCSPVAVLCKQSGVAERESCLRNYKERLWRSFFCVSSAIVLVQMGADKFYLHPSASYVTV